MKTKAAHRLVSGWAVACSEALGATTSTCDAQNYCSNTRNKGTRKTYNVWPGMQANCAWAAAQADATTNRNAASVLRSSIVQASPCSGAGSEKNATVRSSRGSRRNSVREKRRVASYTKRRESIVFFFFKGGTRVTCPGGSAEENSLGHPTTEEFIMILRGLPDRRLSFFRVLQFKRRRRRRKGAPSLPHSVPCSSEEKT